MKLILIIAFILNPIISSACSMYKITSKDYTIVGNNEDWVSPNSQFWFETSTDNKFDVMYMGLLNNFAQGAINEAGLLFDGFYEPYLAINKSKGKLDIPIANALKKVMQTMTNVEEVKTYLETISLMSLTQSMLVFVDKSGTYLIVEGDELIIGEESEKSFSNFYYSQIKSIDEVNLNYFQSGLKFLQSSNKESTMEYCGEVMKNFSQSKVSSTQYSTIYNLKNLKVRVYLFHDYSQFVEIDLNSEFKKNNHHTMIADLFPKDSIGYQHYQKYNNSQNPALYLKEMIGSNQPTEEEFNAMDFGNIINTIGYEWLEDKSDTQAAIKMFKYGLELMPNNSDLLDSLGEAYYVNKELDKSIKNYSKSLAIDKNNNNAKEMLVKINKISK